MAHITCVQVGLLLFGLGFTIVKGQTWPCQWKDSVYAEGSCFLYHGTSMAYSTATNYCKSLSGVLAALTSTKPIGDYLVQIPSGDKIWIGADNKTGKWIWLSTGNEATELIRFWAEGEPNSDPNNKCAYILSGKLYNGYCGDVMKVLCMEIVHNQDGHSQSTSFKRQVTFKRYLSYYKKKNASCQRCGGSSVKGK